MFKPALAVEKIAPLVLWIRHEKILLDFHLAELYGVETRALKQAVRRNRDRFPADFMFELSEREEKDLVSQNVIPRRGNSAAPNPSPLPSKASRCFPVLCVPAAPSP
jgi:ORF6N domain